MPVAKLNWEIGDAGDEVAKTPFGIYEIWCFPRGVVVNFCLGTPCRRIVDAVGGTRELAREAAAKDWEQRVTQAMTGETAAETERYVPISLPKEPPPGLLMSMAIRYDHALGCPGYYDMLGEGMHQKRLAGTLTTMRQLYEEVSGNGFYRPALEAEYANWSPAVGSLENHHG